MPVAADNCVKNFTKVQPEEFETMTHAQRTLDNWFINYYLHRIRTFWHYREDLIKEFRFRWAVQLMVCLPYLYYSFVHYRLICSVFDPCMRHFLVVTLWTSALLADTKSTSYESCSSTLTICMSTHPYRVAAIGSTVCCNVSSCGARRQEGPGAVRWPPTAQGHCRQERDHLCGSSRAKDRLRKPYGGELTQLVCRRPWMTVGADQLLSFELSKKEAPIITNLAIIASYTQTVWYHSLKKIIIPNAVRSIHIKKYHASVN